MDVSKLTQEQLEERWKWLLDGNDFTEVDVEYEIGDKIDVDIEVVVEK